MFNISLWGSSIILYEPSFWPKYFTFCFSSIFLFHQNGMKLGKGFGTCYVDTHTHTHTHTHVGFCGLWGLSIGVMVFILNKLYVLLPYTYPTPKLSPHRRLCISTFPKKTSLCMIYKRFELRGHRQCPHKTPSNCNTSVIPMSLYKFVSS